MKKNTIKNIVLILLCVVSGCNDLKNEYRKKIEEAIHVQIPYEFIVIGTDNSGGIGDYVDQFEVQFSKEDFVLIFNKIDPNLLEGLDPSFKNDYTYGINKQLKSNEFIYIILNKKENTIKYTYTII